MRHSLSLMCLFFIVTLNGCAVQINELYRAPRDIEHAATLMSAADNVTVKEIDDKTTCLSSCTDALKLKPGPHTVTLYIEKKDACDVIQRVVLGVLLRADETYCIKTYGDDRVWIENSRTHSISSVKSFDSFNECIGL